MLLPRFDPAEVLRLVEAEGVTRLFAVPTMTRAILDGSALAGRDLSSLRQVSIGGAPAGRSCWPRWRSAWAASASAATG